MKVFGLTGSIAMGKSEVAKVFQQGGIPVFDSDTEVHRLYDSSQGADLLKDCAPEATVTGRVDRKVLTELILRDKDLLAKLETRVHAAVRRRRDQFIADAQSQGAKVAIVDVPLLFETGAEKGLDGVIVVSAPENDQRARALARPGMTVDRLDLILKRQMPDKEKRSRATYILENTGTLADLHSATTALISRLLEDA